ncbi:MAG: hypothetical protein AAFX93_07430 [Verrucomicrobiota bacterium]
MDLNKIKERLATIRPDCLDPDDPEMAELLALVEEDLELAEWFAQEQVFDRVFAQKLESIEAPEGLDDRIVNAMTEAKAKQTAEAAEPVEETVTEAPATEEPLEEPEKVVSIESEELEAAEAPAAQSEPEEAPADDVGTAVPFCPEQRRPWWQNPSLVSVAAAIVLLVAVGMIMFDGPPASANSDIDSFHNHIGTHHNSSAPLDHQSESLDELREFLASRGAPSPRDLPAGVDALPEVGCAVIQWQGQQVSVIKMRNGDHVSLYVVRKAIFPSDYHASDPVPANVGTVSIVRWSNDDLLYFLVRSGSVGDIETLF